MSIFSVGGGNAAADYEIDQSLRFNDGDSPELVRSVTVAGNRRTSTWSAWVKIGWSTFSNDAGTIEPTHTLFCCGNSDGRWNVGFSNATAINNNLPQLFIGQRDSGGGQAFEVSSTQAFRDPSAWYHIVVVMDTTQSTNTDRVKAYVNGERITDWGVTSWPSQNYDSDVFRTADPVVKVRVGSTVTNSNTGDRFWDGYIAEVNVVDGTALDASYFGETKATTGQWIPKKVSGVTYGTNGFYLPFSSVELANSFSDSAERSVHTLTAAGNVQTDTSVKKIGTASALFDGTDDVLKVDGSNTQSTLNDFIFGTNDFTLEAWVYPHSGGAGEDYFISKTGEGSYSYAWTLQYTHSNNKFMATWQSGSGASGSNYIEKSTTDAADAWHHVAFTRNGNTFTLWVNGVSAGTSSDSNALVNVATADNFVNIGGATNSSGIVYDWDGNIDEVRISNNCRYTGTFTPSTTAFTADVNTLLLLHMDGSNGGTTFTDSSWTGPRHTITANGDVANTRAQSKIGNSSIYFDGTGDYLEIPDSNDWDFGSSSWTVEGWFNVSSWTDSSFIWNQWASDNNFAGIRLLSGGDLNFLSKSSGSVVHNIDFTSVDLPTDTWVHLAVVRDTSAGNFVIYKDGTSVGSSSNATAIPDVTGTARINGGRVYGNYWTGYLDEFRVSNSARYTGAFTPSTTAFTADSYTKLLIHSDFNGGLGADNSGNKNDLDPTNLVVTDQVLDSPTNNFCTFNPLVTSSSNSNYSEGNLYATDNGSADWEVRLGTIPLPETGKWYWECRVGNGNAYIGILDEGENITVTNPSGGVIWYGDDGRKRIDGTFSSYGAGYGSANVLGVAVDMDASPRTIEFYKDNTSQGSITITGDCATGTVIPYITSIVQTWINFGQDSSFAGSKTAQGNQDGNGKGDFYYTPPTGYLALCIDNLSDPGIALPTAHFNTILYTGNGGTQALTGVGFAPDFTWIKSRSNGSSNALFDTVRGATKELISNDTAAEQTFSDSLTAFNSDGFTLGADTSGAHVNVNTYTYASWNWKAGGTASSNGDGSITSSVSANTTAGFSIVSYTGHGSTTGTVGHGLSVKPDLIITKYRSGTASWSVYNSPQGATKVIWLDDTSAEGTGITYWRDTEPTASVFSVGASGTTGGNANPYIAYCFHSVEGYSKVGTYTGNNSTDGTFVYLGFTPAFILLKTYDHTDNWNIYDIKRNGYNGTGGTYQIRADTNEAGFSSAATMIDLVSNGVKMRTNDPGTNSSRNYLYMAFAESPFKTSNAR